MSAKRIFPFIVPGLKAGQVGVLPTDTIYGIVGSALRPGTVRRIYSLRKRDPKKPMIILIGDMRDLARFGAVPDRRTKKVLRRVWPGKVSVILSAKKFRYLHRGTNTLAFRLPKPNWLRALLRATGPLVAPSANFEVEQPARTIAGAKRYFGDRVEFYVDFGEMASKPSKLISVRRGVVAVLRR